MIKPKAPRPIHAVILDKDNCEFDTLHRFGTVSGLIARLSRRLRVPHDAIRRCIREADAEIRFHDGVKLIDNIARDLNLQPTDPAQTNSFDWHINSIKRDWTIAARGASRYYVGILPALKTWNKSGTFVITQTDCEALPLIRGMYDVAINAVFRGQISHPEDILKFYDVISCHQGLLPPIDQNGGANERETYLNHYAQTYKIPRGFIDHILNHPRFIINYGTHKPNAVHLKTVMDRFAVEPDRAVYIGDSHKDGLEAKQAGVDFIWAAYGTNLPPSLIHFCNDVASRSYSYGREAIETLIHEHHIPLAGQVENSAGLLDQMEARYNFVPHALKQNGFA